MVSYLGAFGVIEVRMGLEESRFGGLLDRTMPAVATFQVNFEWYTWDLDRCRGVFSLDSPNVLDLNAVSVVYTAYAVPGM